MALKSPNALILRGAHSLPFVDYLNIDFDHKPALGHDINRHVSEDNALIRKMV